MVYETVLMMSELSLRVKLRLLFSLVLSLAISHGCWIMIKTRFWVIDPLQGFLAHLLGQFGLLKFPAKRNWGGVKKECLLDISLRMFPVRFILMRT